MINSTISFEKLFLNFESSVFLLRPVRLFLILITMLLINSYINNIKRKILISDIIIHFSSLNYYTRILFMFSIFVLILLFNVFRLVPGIFPLSSLPVLTLRIAVVLWLGGYLYCLKKNLLRCVSHYLPLGAPIVLSVFLVWVEVLSWLIRPIALGVRLMANITARHLLLTLVRTGVFLSRNYFILPFVFMLLLIAIEVGVAIIQSYVYNLLLSLYIDERL